MIFLEINFEDRQGVALLTVSHISNVIKKRELQG
jgi:hypothetical protein